VTIRSLQAPLAGNIWTYTGRQFSER